MKKQTAVEWLAEQLEKGITGEDAWFDLLDKAKEMQKELIIEAYNEGALSVVSRGGNAEKYYNETFKSE